MTDILTPAQIAEIKDKWSHSANTPTWGGLLASHEALRVERDSWQATAEELGDKNVNKALTQRHEMREATLRAQLAETESGFQNMRAEREMEQAWRQEVQVELAGANSDLLTLAEVLQAIAKPDGVYSRDREQYLKNVLDGIIQKAEEALARPGVKTVMADSKAG